MAQSVFVTPSTTVVQVNTLQTPYTPVLLNSYTYEGQVVTVLDGTSSVGVLYSSIVVSTVSGTTYADGSISTLINQPQGFVTVQAQAPNLWAFLNSFPFRNQYLSAGLYTFTTSTFTSATLSTIQQYTNSLTVEKLVVSGNFLQSSPIVFNQTISTFGTVDLYSSFSVWQSSFFSSGFSTLGAVQLFSTLTVDGNFISLSSIRALSTVNVSGSVSVVDFVSSGQINLSGGLLTQSLFVTNSTFSSVNIAGSVDVANRLRVLSSVNVGGDFTTSTANIQYFSTLSSLALYGPLNVQTNITVNETFSNDGKLVVVGHLSTGTFTNIYQQITGRSNIRVGGFTQIEGTLSTQDFFASTLFVQGNLGIDAPSEVFVTNMNLTSSFTVSEFRARSLLVGGVFSTTASLVISSVLSSSADFFTEKTVNALDMYIGKSTNVSTFSTGNLLVNFSTYFFKNLVVVGSSFWNQTPQGSTNSILGDLSILRNLTLQDTLILSSIVLPSSVVANNFTVSSLFCGYKGIAAFATISSIEASSIGTGGIEYPGFTMDMSNQLVTLNFSTFLMSSLLFEAKAIPDGTFPTGSFFEVTSSLGVGFTASTNTFQVAPLAVTTCNLISLEILSTLQVFGGTITATLQGDATGLSNTQFPIQISTGDIVVSTLTTRRLEASSFFTSTIQTNLFIPTSTLTIGNLAIYGNIGLIGNTPSLSTPTIFPYGNPLEPLPIPRPANAFFRQNQQVRLNTLVGVGDNLGEASVDYRGGVINYDKLQGFENNQGMKVTLAIGDTLRVDTLPGTPLLFEEFKGGDITLYGEPYPRYSLSLTEDTVSFINKGLTYVSTGFVGLSKNLFMPEGLSILTRSTNIIQPSLSTLQFNSTMFVNREALTVGIGKQGIYAFDVKGTAYAPSTVVMKFSTIVDNQLTVQQLQDNYWLGVGAKNSVNSNLRYSRDGQTWENISMNSTDFYTNEATFLSIGSDGGKLGVNVTVNGDSNLHAPTTWVTGGFYDDPFSEQQAYLAYTLCNLLYDQWNQAIVDRIFKVNPYQYTSPQFNGQYWIATALNYVDQELLDAPRATLLRSTDGVNWEYVNSGGFVWNQAVGGNTFAGGRACAWNGSLWVAVGWGSNLGNSILYSGNGQNWSNSVNGFQTGTGATNKYSGGFGIVWTGKHWVAAGNTYTGMVSTYPTGILYSTDGSNWTEPSTPYGIGIARAIGWNGSRLVTAGGTGILGMFYSDDHGVSWLSCVGDTAIIDENGSGSIVWNGSYWLVSGSLGVSKSVNGINWTLQTNKPTFGLAYSSNAVPSLAIGRSTLELFSTVAVFPTLNVAVGDISGTEQGKTIYTSENGSNWTVATSGTFDKKGNCVAFGGGRWVAGGSNTNSSNILISSDGKNWSYANIGINPSYPEVRALFYVNTRWVAGIDYGLNYNSVVYSTDGLTWNTIASPYTTPTGATYAIGYGPTGYGSSDLFVIGGAGNGLYTSPDGAVWTSRTPTAYFDSGGQVRGISYLNGLWFAVGYDGTPTATIKRSSDAVNWLNSSYDVADFSICYGIAYGGGLYVAVGTTSASGGTIKYSGVGSGWSNAVSGEFTNTAYSVTYNTELALWIATGTNDGTNAHSVRYSGDGSNWSNSSGIDFTTGLGVAFRTGSTITTSIQSYYNQIRFYNNPLPEVVTRQVTPSIVYSPSSLVLNNALMLDNRQNVLINSMSTVTESPSFITAQNIQSTFINFDLTNVTQTVSTQRILMQGAFTLGTQYI